MRPELAPLLSCLRKWGAGMNFSDAIESGIRRFVDFNGRSSRSEYWYFFLFTVIFGVVLSVSHAIALAIGHGPNSTATAFTVISYLVDLAFFLPSLALFVRRMHDTNRSGWWYFLAFTGVGLIPLVIWLCARGTIGENRFGDDPLSTDHPAVKTDEAWVS
jgi:uncharacterized membrane protein YhaH (DUF805 family)